MSKQYAKHLQEFVAFGYNQHFLFEEIHQPGAIPRDLLLSIKPEKIVEWFQYKAYRKSIIGEEDQPKEC